MTDEGRDGPPGRRETDAGETDSGESDSTAEAAAARRARTLALLGELLPEQSSDDTALGWGEHGRSSRDEEYLRDVPPHHGG